MRARNQSSIFSIGENFCPDYGLVLELHALTVVARSYALLFIILFVCNNNLQFCKKKKIATGHSVGGNYQI